MAAGHRALMRDVNNRRLPRPRVFRDRSNPLEELNDDELYERFRFRRDSILFIVEAVDEVARATKRSFAIPLILGVLTYLRYLAAGVFQLTVADTVKLSQATVSRLCRQIGEALAQLGDRLIKFPDQASGRQVKQRFGMLAGFPNVLGIIDCTHVWIKKPTVNPEDYIGRKGVPTIIVQAVCDPNYRFTSVVAMWPGRTHDARIWRQCALKQRFEEGACQGFLLADSGYPCARYMLTPYLNPVSPSQNRYNGALCRTRVVVEQSFGILKQRFQVLRRKINSTPETACLHIKNCFILHNIGVDRNDIVHEQPLEQYNENFHHVHGEDQADGRDMRDYICRSYFQA